MSKFKTEFIFITQDLIVKNWVMSTGHYILIFEQILMDIQYYWEFFNISKKSFLILTLLWVASEMYMLS